MIAPVMHQLTWNEVISSKVAVINSQGVLCAGPDRRLETGSRQQFSQWLKDCQFRMKHHNDLRPEVMAAFQALKHFTTPPTITPKTTPHPEPKPIFAMPRWSWSFSAISAFETCPLQYAHKYFYKTIKYRETAATRKGNEIHAALERTLKGKPNQSDKSLIDTNKWSPFVNSMLNAPGERYVELEMGLDENWKPTLWKQATGRCKGDVIIINGDKANYFDWKTGKNIKDDPLQLKLSLLFIALNFPQVKQFNGKFIWLEFNKVTGLDKPIPRKELIETYEDVKARLIRIKESWETQVFPANKSGLCRNHCEVVSCSYCGK